MPGISVSKICVPFGGGGINWSSYWATRKPSDLIVTGMRDTEIDFSWTDNSAGDCSFKVYKSTDGVNFSADGTTVAGDTTYTATGLTAGNLYYFYVVGVKSSNESDPTDTYDTRFKITVDTTKAGSASDTFILGLYKHVSASYDFYIDWGDGSAEEHISGTNINYPSHTYSTGGTYQVKLRGSNYAIFRPGAGSGDAAKIMYIDNCGNIKITNFSNAFIQCINVQGRYVDTFNTASATSMAGAFYNCPKFNYPVNFTTSNVTDFSNMFRGCSIFNQSISNFNTAKGKNFSYMFYQCYAFNQSVVNIDTHLATNLTNMFGRCSVFNQDVSGFNTSSATSMLGMFVNCYAFAQDLSGLNYEAIVTTGLSNFIDGCTSFGTSRYDALLISMAGQSINSGVTFGAHDTTYTPGGTAEAARTTLTTTYSWTIDDAGPSFSNGLFIINFDDGGASQYVAFEDLVTQGEKATFYIIGSYPGTGSALNWAQVQAMYAGGMDIQCHTYDHTALTLLTESEVYAEYDNLDAIFISNGLPAANHTSYPYGANDANVQAWTATKRLTARTVNQGYVIPSSDKFTLKTYGMDVSTDYDALKAAMLVAQNNKWGIMAYGHGINGIQIPRDKFNEIIDYAQSIGMSIVTVSEMYALMT